MSYDLIIKGAEVATAADVFRADIGIRDGKVATLGLDLGDATETIDASGLYAVPGGIDSHVHIAQPAGPNVIMADDFESATLAAAFGGNTTVLPFACRRTARPCARQSTPITPRRRATAMSTSAFT